MTKHQLMALAAWLLAALPAACADDEAPADAAVGGDGDTGDGDTGDGDSGDGDSGDGDAGGGAGDTDDGDAGTTDGMDAATEPADAGPTPDADVGRDAAEPIFARAPRRMLLVDEGNAAVHYLNLEAPADNWTYALDVQDPCCNRLRDIQLVGDGKVMVSRPAGFVELDLTDRGRELREVDYTGLPGGVESARRLTNGHTVVAGNGGGGVFVTEFDENGKLVTEHNELFAGLDKLRALRMTDEGTFLFSSDTAAGKAVYEGTWAGQAKLLYKLPSDLPAGHMTKAVRTGPNEVTLSTGYGASLIRIDTQNMKLKKLIGGTDQPEPEGLTRPLHAHFFAGFQVLANGDYVVANWVNHGTGHNGEGYQLLQYDAGGTLVWALDQTQFPEISSLHNVLVLDGLDLTELHDDRAGVVTPL